MKRGGIANTVIQAILTVLLLLGAGVLFVGAFLVGLFVLDAVAPVVLLYVWDGLVVAFLFLWSVGVLSELQRSESLALEKFLHLPVSLSAAFLINYLSSLLSVNLILFLPAMLGLSLGLILAWGPKMLLLLPLLAAFVLMVSAAHVPVSGLVGRAHGQPTTPPDHYRRRHDGFRVDLSVTEFGESAAPWEGQQLKGNELATQMLQQQNELQHELEAKKITFPEYQKRQAEIQPRIIIRFRRRSSRPGRCGEGVRAG